jgi:squalene synthase HpnC
MSAGVGIRAEPGSLPSPAAVMAQAGAENFPVASRLLPPRVRADLLAVYGFARLVDDIGDQATGDRLAMLDEVEADLERLWAGETPRHQLIAGLQAAKTEHGLPIQPFRALIEANRRDQRVHRYATFAELVGYCELSANPVGELVLRIFDAATPERLELSNHVCTALQLAEHCQDVAEDYAAGRIYLPQEDLSRFGVAETDLARPSTPAALRQLMAFEVQRAGELLDQGAPLARTLRGRPAFAVRAFVAGGRAALTAIERSGYDVLAVQPRAGRTRRAGALLRELWRGQGPQGGAQQ